VMHEMATNAAKYGALSSGEGRLTVSWAIIGDAGPDRLRLTWDESGGPPVSEPTRSGFGSRLVSQSITRDLGGRIDLDYRAGGLHCVMEIPVDAEPASAVAA